MNQVSDLKLAIACQNAGIFPSISAFNYWFQGKINIEKLENDIKSFQDITGTNKILISVGASDFFQKYFFHLILKLNVKFLELIGNEPGIPMPEDTTLFWEYKKNNIKMIPKVFDLNLVIKNADAVMLKGKNGAGRSIPIIDQDDEIDKIKNLFPSLPIIISGGIGTSQDIDKYLSKGCIAVAIGTLLAASAESSLSIATKLKMVDATSDNIRQFKNGAYQKALIFKEIDSNDDYNHTSSLIKGIKTPNEGHIFAGTSLDNITAIRPVKDIVENLMQGLDNFIV
jgi:NAD(P)H-dependent flavin oxidoreductase YrpB (nitropropane dioxygenase family)